MSNETTGIRDVQLLSNEAQSSLYTYLTNSIVGFKGPLTITQFSNGQSNPTFLLSTPSQSYVLRKKPAGKLLLSAHAVDREFTILNALYKVGFPVPRPVLYCSDTSVLGVEFYVMDYVVGRIFRTPSLPELSPKERSQVYEETTRVLALLHSFDYKKLGLESYGKPSGYYERQIHVWSRNYKASVTHEIQSMDKLMDWLPKSIPNDDRVSIVHGDFRIENIIFHPTQIKVIAVLDWELSTIGNPLADIAYFTMPYYFLPNHSENIYTGILGIEKELGIPTLPLVVSHYSRLTNRPDGVKDWHFYVAFGFFRMASILQGVYKRALQGNASSQNAKQTGLYAQRFADEAIKVVERAVGKIEIATVSPQKEQSIFGFPPHVHKIINAVEKFMNEFVIPNEEIFNKQHASLPNRWMIPPIVEELKSKAKNLGLWSLFLPHPPQHLKHLVGGGSLKIGTLSNFHYAPICEIMGRSFLGPEIFNCNAPDTGNMEVLSLYGNREQQDRWLAPLLKGEIRSCFAMTEPAVASSDATNIQTEMKKVGTNYVINGRKWWASGAGDPRCKVIILMGKTDPENPSRHKQQSMILVDMSAPGVKVVRPLTVFGFDDAPHGHCEISFENVVVPETNIILGPGRGFEIAQGRLGPGRIHHCMRLIGLAERALELMVQRSKSRTAFNKKISDFGSVRKDIAISRIEIDQARLLTLQAAHLMDTKGNRHARGLIAMIKAVAPQMACNVIDRAIQVHGGMGVCSDTFLAGAYAGARTLRIADGPDEVHIETIARLELSGGNKPKHSDEGEKSELEILEKAASELSSLDPTPNDMLTLYGLYKQATSGDNTTKKPEDFKGAAKWDMWSINQGMSKSDAIKKYIQYINDMKKRSQNTKSKL